MRLKELRENAGWSQSDIATRLGIATSTIGMYEQGRRTPSPKILVKMSKIFNVSVEYILGESPKGVLLSGEKVSDYESFELPEDYVATEMYKKLSSDEEGRKLLISMVKEKVDELNLPSLDVSTVKSIGKMMVSIKDEEIKKAKLEIVRDIVELDFTIEQLYTFSSFLKSFKTK